MNMYFLLAIFTKLFVSISSFYTFRTGISEMIVALFCAQMAVHLNFLLSLWITNNGLSRYKLPRFV